MARSFWSMTATSLALLLALPAQAAVYRWVDDDGVVQYGDYPPAGIEAELIDPGAGIADEVADPQPTLEPETEADAAADSDDAMPNTLEEFCDEVRAQLETLDSSEQVGMANEDGEIEPLSDDERAEHRNALQQQLDQSC